MFANLLPVFAAMDGVGSPDGKTSSNGIAEYPDEEPTQTRSSVFGWTKCRRRYELASARSCEANPLPSTSSSLRAVQTICQDIRCCLRTWSLLSEVRIAPPPR